MSQESSQGWWLLAADVLTGLVVLDSYVRDGVPEQLGDARDPLTELVTVFDALRPDDFPARARGVYVAMMRARVANWPLCRVQIPEKLASVGLWCGYMARSKAETLLTLSAARRELEEHSERAAEALERFEVQAGGVR